jgi:hypothetical protein
MSVLGCASAEGQDVRHEPGHRLLREDNSVGQLVVLSRCDEARVAELVVEVVYLPKLVEHQLQLAVGVAQTGHADYFGQRQVEVRQAAGLAVLDD